MLIVKPESNATSSSQYESLFSNRDAKRIEEPFDPSLHGWGKQEGYTEHR